MITVSIVDDDAGIRESIGQYLNSSKGYRCVSAYANAAEALERIPIDKPDVVLMDINMTGMNGIECTAKLKAAMPQVQILMLTVFEESESIFKALASGASGYMLKRVPPAKLLEAVRDVSEGGAPMSGPIARKVVQSFQPTANTNANEDSNETLSPREKQVLELLIKGLVYKQISDQLGISIDTIRTYIRRIYDKLHVHSRTEAVAKYLRL